MSDAAPAPLSAACLVSFRFHGALATFIAPARRGRVFEVRCATDASIKHVIEALGVPHTEVGTLRVDGRPARLDGRLRPGERVKVHPHSALRRAPCPSLPPRFVADAHLGGLARLLRLAGFDTLYDNRIEDAALVATALREQRIVLTRDRELLKRRDVAEGCFVHALAPEHQAVEILRRLGLASHARPFSRCLECNAALQEAVSPAAAEHRVPPAVRARHTRFSACPGCGRVYWEGSHWTHMRARIDAVLAQAHAAPGDEAAD
jgi:hypothetical protein